MKSSNGLQGMGNQGFAVRGKSSLFDLQYVHKMNADHEKCSPKHSLFRQPKQ